MLLPGNQKTYDPDFVLRVGGRDVTKITQRWCLEDVEDGISSLTVTLANPDLKYSGVFKTEQEISLNFGYHRGQVSPTIRMKIKDKKEHFPTRQGPTIKLVALDCQERLVGTSGAGNGRSRKYPELMRSILKGHKINAEIAVKGVDVPDGPTPFHNMRSIEAVRWLMDSTESFEPERADGETPIAGQPENYDWGPEFPEAEVFEGDRISVPAKVDATWAEIDRIRARQIRNKAAGSPIIGCLELVGQPTLQAKKCLTVQNVGSEASGKWYIKRLVQEWDVGHGYRTFCNLLRPTLGPDGQAVDQPVVMYADIYKTDTVYIGPRKIDSESQATFTYGTGENVMDFWWGIKLARARAAGERVRSRGYQINQWGQTHSTEAQKIGSYKTYPPPIPGIMD